MFRLNLYDPSHEALSALQGLFGGKPGMISGAAGALAVVVADLTVDDGVLKYLCEFPLSNPSSDSTQNSLARSLFSYTAMAERLNVLYMTMFVCGVFQILFAIFRLATLVRLIPETGMIGFMK